MKFQNISKNPEGNLTRVGIILESHVRKRKLAKRKGKAWGFFGKFVYSQPPFIRLISYNPTIRKKKTKL